MAGEDLALTEQKMGRVVEALERDLQRLKTGAASASLLDGVYVDHQGRRARLVDMATITIPDPRQILIVPWDPSSLRAIGTAIRQSRIGLTPTVDGSAIRLYVPGLTEERRRELATLVHKRVEQARVEVRSIRHETLAAAKVRQRALPIGADEVRRDGAALQRMTDRFVGEIDRRGQAREATILRV